MTPVTEIVNVLLKTAAIKTVEDDSSEAGKAFASMREILPRQAGYLGSYWGCTIEDPNRVIWLIDWEEISFHRIFEKSPSHDEFLEMGKSIFDLTDKGLFITHVDYQPFPPSKAVEAPATEVAMFTVERSANRAHIKLAAAQLMKVVSTDIPGKAVAYSTGWVLEEIAHPKATGGKGLGYACLIGWESVEAHMKARETEEFAKAIAPIRKSALAPLEGKSMMHVHFRKS